jgi:hypothetical protein
MASVETTATSKGLVLHLYKWGRHVFASFDGKPTEAFTGNTALWTIPAAYRPAYMAYIPVLTGGGVYTPGKISITTGGVCTYNGNTSTTTTNDFTGGGSWLTAAPATA